MNKEPDSGHNRMMVRPLGLSEWITLARRGADGLQEHVVGPEAWKFRLALKQSVVGQLLPRGEHWHMWVAIDNDSLQGLIVTSPRQSQQIWQVSHLLVAQEQEEITHYLLQQINAASCRHGIEKLFLRLPEDSPLAQVAFDSGFERYLVQRIYRRSAERSLFTDPYQETSGIWRARTKHDNWDIFQMYSGIVPAVIRQAEGLAFSDWLRSRERAPGGQDQVWERDGHVHGWASIRPWWDGIIVEATLPPGEEHGFVQLVDSLVNTERPVYTIISSYQTHIQQVAQGEGFTQVAECSLFLKRLLVRVTQTNLMPMSA